MDASGVKRDRVWLAVVALVAVVLVAVGAYTCSHRPFVSPLTITSPLVAYLPLVSKQHRAPDRRIGVAEHTPMQASLLGLASADYI